MRIPRIYTTQELVAGKQLELEAGPSHHLIKVLRMGEGRELIVFNGNGNEYPAVITHSNKKTASILIQSEIAGDRQSPLDIELAIALSKGDRFELVLQKATELGVHSITPLRTERSEVKLNAERLEKKMLSWQNIIIGACEQCQRNILPRLNSPLSLQEFLQNNQRRPSFVLHHRSETNLAQWSKEDGSKPNEVALIIGPEGGLSDEEIGAALQQGCAPLALGPRVLRTETAPLAALSILQYLWGDLS